MTGRPGVALVTAARLPDGMADTPGLVAALTALGTAVRVVPWDDPGTDWAQFDVVVPHCTWDWTDRREEFRGWLRRCEPFGNLANPLALLEWTFDKAYLLQLAASGIEVPATVRLERGDLARPDALRERFGPAALVVKPAVGGGGHQIWRCAGPDDAAETARTRLPDGPVLVQEFQESVTSGGEFSAVFIAGQVSHATCKRPQDGDFRVHRRYGATRETVDVRPWMVDYGHRVVTALGTTPLYARVDFLLPERGRPVLMEVELLEPDLYLREHPGAPQRLAAALNARAARRGTVT